MPVPRIGTVIRPPVGSAMPVGLRPKNRADLRGVIVAGSGERAGPLPGDGRGLRGIRAWTLMSEIQGILDHIILDEPLGFVEHLPVLGRDVDIVAVDQGQFQAAAHG